MIGLFGGVAANGKWRTFLLWANRESFHTADPVLPQGRRLLRLHAAVAALRGRLRDRRAGAVARSAAIVVHYLYGGIRLQAATDRMSGDRARSSSRSLGGLALLAKAVGYYLDRFDLVTGSGSVVTGMGYTDQHALLPARNILIGVALICALLFFVTAWRRIWLLPGVGISLLVVTSILLGADLAGVRPALPGRPQPAGQGSVVHHREHRRDAQGLRPELDQAGPAEGRAGDPGQRADPDRPDDLGAGGRPAADLRGVRADRRRCTATTACRRCSTSTTTRSTASTGSRDRGPRARPDRHQQHRPELVQPAHHLHPRQRRHRGVRQPAAAGQLRREPADPVGAGTGPRTGLAGEGDRPVREADLLRRRAAPATRSSARPPVRRTARSTSTRTARRTARRTPAGAGSASAASSTS